MKNHQNKYFILYFVGMVVGMVAWEGNFYQALLACVAGGIAAGCLISKFTKEVK